MKAHFPVTNSAQTACLLILLLLSSSLFGQLGVRAQCLTDQTYQSPGLYSFTVPAGGPFQMRATVRGADGGVSGGSGATAVSNFSVQSGDQLTIMVGEFGRTNNVGGGINATSGGGGGTAIILTRNGAPTLLIAAGGGGGANAVYNLFGGGGQGVGPSTGGGGGQFVDDPANGGGGGGGGLGGAGSVGQGTGGRVGGGGGQASLTAISPGGSSSVAPGGTGFGGGGGGSPTSNGSGGGGGGYGGGRGGDARGGGNTTAQGGYSFVSPTGSATAITTGVQQGSQNRNGLVTIEFLNSPASVAITRQPASGSTVCAGAAVTAQVSTSGPVTGYQWYKDGALVSGQTSATLTLPSTTTASAGSYSVVVTGCNSVTSNAFALTVNPLPIQFMVTGGGSYCADGTGAGVGLSGSQTGVTYQLLRASNPVGNPVAGTGNALSFGNQTTVGTYTVRATTTSTACSQTMNGGATVTTTAQPSVSLSNDGPLTCAKTSVTLTARSPASGTFVFGGPGLSQTGPATTATVSQTGVYSVTLTAAGGCSASATTTVTGSTAPPANVSLSGGTLTCAQPSVTLTAASTGGTTYIFSGGTPLGTNQVVVNSAGTYSVTATATNGCSASVSTTVDSQTALATPTLLTQRGQAYPGGQSAVSVVQYSPSVILEGGNCGGTLIWTTPGGTTGTGHLSVPTTRTGSFVYSATCQVGACVSAPASATVTVQSAALALLIARYDCATGQLSLRTTGGNGQPVEFHIPSLSNGWSEQTDYVVEAEKLGKTLKIKARQRDGNGWDEATLEFVPTACGGAGRLATEGLEVPLEVVVLGNPVTGQQVEVEVRGASGQPLHLRLVDSQGREVASQQRASAGAIERVSLVVSNQPAGLLLLRISTPTQSRTVKVLKTE